MMNKRRETERRFIAAQPVELRAGADGKPTELHGYAAVFNQWATISDFWGDAFQERVAPGAYAKTIGEADIRALFNHDPSIVLGRNKAGTLDLVEDATGLRDVIRPPDNEWGRPVLDAVQRGDVTGQSIAFQVVKEEWKRPDKKSGDDLTQRTILEARLLDVSIVTYPAFEQTSVQARALFDNEDEIGIIGRAFRLARLAEHGYVLDAAERSAVRAALAVLQRVSVEPGGDVRRDHSATGADDEPGTAEGEHAGSPQRTHSPEARARTLQLYRMALENVR
jgi:uncharacterized protein